MLTLFTIPKPFHGHIGSIQENAIRSWAKLRPACEVILFGDDNGTAEMASEFGFRHVPDIERNKYGTPLLNNVFSNAQRLAFYDFLCYVNTDIILMSNFIRAIERVVRKMNRFLMVGQRWDIDFRFLFDFGPKWEETLKNIVRQRGVLHAETGIDYFVFPRGLFGEIPPFAIGRTAWDNWLIYKARSLKVEVVNLSPVTTIIHQNHDYAHVPGSNQLAWKGPEAIINNELAGGQEYSFNLYDSTYLLTPHSLRRSLGIKYLWRRFNTLSVLYPIFLRVKIVKKLFRISSNIWGGYTFN